VCASWARDSCLTRTRSPGTGETSCAWFPRCGAALNSHNRARPTSARARRGRRAQSAPSLQRWRSFRLPSDSCPQPTAAFASPRPRACKRRCQGGRRRRQPSLPSEALSPLPSQHDSHDPDPRLSAHPCCSRPLRYCTTPRPPTRVCLPAPPLLRFANFPSTLPATPPLPILQLASSSFTATATPTPPSPSSLRAPRCRWAWCWPSRPSTTP
jgi:hypothetical protein